LYKLDEEFFPNDIPDEVTEDVENVFIINLLAEPEAAE